MRSQCRYVSISRWSGFYFLGIIPRTERRNRRAEFERRKQVAESGPQVDAQWIRTGSCYQLPTLHLLSAPEGALYYDADTAQVAKAVFKIYPRRSNEQQVFGYVELFGNLVNHLRTKFSFAENQIYFYFRIKCIQHL